MFPIDAEGNEDLPRVEPSKRDEVLSVARNKEPYMGHL